MAQDTDPNPRQQITFLVIFGVAIAVLIFAVSLYLPQDAARLAYIACWTALIAGAFWVGERVIGGMVGKKK
jgi:hypothetical protein